MVNRENFIIAFDRLGQILEKVGKDQDITSFELGITPDEYRRLKDAINIQEQQNGWFTKENIQLALLSIASLLKKEKLQNWTEKYSFASSPKKVGIIMAGNIPLVGFHDLLCVVLSGNCAVCKMSSNDHTLLPILVEILGLFSPSLKDRIVFAQSALGEIDAVIATGSNNSSRYFEQYFGKYPHIFRQNRTSIAILDGTENIEQLTELGKDIFYYFGLGCRNVSHLILPKNYPFPTFIQAISPYQNLIFHNKYANNYDYNKAIYLMNKIPIIDTGFVLLRETNELHSPLSVLHYHFYENEYEIENYLQEHKESLQAIIGKRYLSFGEAQHPTLTDYADNINTLQWLQSINKVNYVN